MDLRLVPVQCCVNATGTRTENQMALTRTPRSRWIEEGLRAIAAGGPDAVRVETLARALGVTKGGFYWHFEDRRALLGEMLDEWERVGVDEVIARVELEGGDARTRLRRLFELASRSGELLRIDLAVRDWARRERAVAKRVRRVDNRRMDYLRSLFGAFCADEDDVEARSLMTLSLWIAPHFIVADYRGRTRAQVLQLALRRLEAT
jgi:AcrR family transcriptional regulator